MKATATFSPPSEVNEFNLEEKRSVGRDYIASASITVGVGRWASEDGFLTLLKLSYALVPASYHLAFSDNKLERLAAGQRRIKDCAVSELASVVDLNPSAWWADWSSSFVELLDCE